MHHRRNPSSAGGVAQHTQMYASPQQPAQAPHPRAQLPEPESLIEETFRQARFLGSDFTDTLRFCGAASYATTTQTVRVQPCQHRNAAGQARHAPRRRVRSRRAQRRRTLGRQRRCASQRSVKPPCAEQPAGPARPCPDRPRQRARPRAPLTLVVEQPPDPGEEDPHPRPAPAAAGSSAPAARGCPWPRPPQGPARRPACGRGPPRRACSRCALRAERPPRADIAAARAPPLRSSRRAFPQAAGRHRSAPQRAALLAATVGHAEAVSPCRRREATPLGGRWKTTPLARPARGCSSVPPRPSQCSSALLSAS